MFARNVFEQGVLNVLRGQTFQAPAAVYVGLLTANPGDAGEVQEISYTGYSRVEAIFSPPAYDDSLLEWAIKLTNNATFAEAPAAAGTVSHIGIFDSATPGAGTCWLYGELSEPIVVDAGEAPGIVAGEIAYMLAGDFTENFKSKVLGFFRGVSIPGITPYLALYNGPNELAASNYARVPVAFAAPAESETGVMYVTNTALLSFNQSSTAWGTYNAFVVLDSATDGVEYLRRARGADKNIGRLKRVQFKAGTLKVGIN